jgi:hypothetical protein
LIDLLVLLLALQIGPMWTLLEKLDMPSLALLIDTRCGIELMA